MYTRNVAVGLACLDLQCGGGGGVTSSNPTSREKNVVLPNFLTKRNGSEGTNINASSIFKKGVCDFQKIPK
jgi:hypothetical protein